MTPFIISYYTHLLQTCAEECFEAKLQSLYRSYSKLNCYHWHTDKNIRLAMVFMWKQSAFYTRLLHNYIFTVFTNFHLTSELFSVMSMSSSGWQYG